MSHRASQYQVCHCPNGSTNRYCWSGPVESKGHIVFQRLKSNFVLTALYVDDKTTLSEPDWFTSVYDGKVKKTIGKQNADFQITRFNNNAQPFYVILDHDGNLLTEPLAYDLNVNTFVEFLDRGYQNYKGE